MERELGTLSYSGGWTFAYTGKPGTCRWCGVRLKTEYGNERVGYRGNGKFCTIRCGYQWAVRAA